MYICILKTFLYCPDRQQLIGSVRASFAGIPINTGTGFTVASFTWSKSRNHPSLCQLRNGETAGDHSIRWSSIIWLKRNTALTRATTWLGLEDTMQRSKSRKATYSLLPFNKMSQTGKSRGTVSRLVAARGRGGRPESCCYGVRRFFLATEIKIVGTVVKLCEYTKHHGIRYSE